MVEHIEREKICNLLSGVPTPHGVVGWITWAFIITDLIDKVNKIPASDVVPVIHAHWIYHHDITGNYYSCSHCTCGRVENPEKYCHECGAKMDGKDGGSDE